MKLELSKLQRKLISDIAGTEHPAIYVLGSTQSGKTFAISLACILYAKKLQEYDPNNLYYGAIIGWSISSIKGNILDVITRDLEEMKINPADYKINWGGGDDKSIQIYNMKYYFYGFNNKVSYNKILGKPLIFEWVDESAKIYSSPQLQESFDQLPTRQMSYVAHPYYKTIHSFNVEGNSRHPYKVKYIDGTPKAQHYTFFPYDNPKINSKLAMERVLDMFPAGSPLQRQKVYNEWVISEGKVFTSLHEIDSLDNYAFREIGIGIDYGSVNPTTFVPLALVYNKILKRWELIRLEVYYHDPKKQEDEPTTEYYSNQLRLFLLYLKNEYGQVPITTVVLDSEATHFHNRLDADNIPHELANKYPGSVVEGVQRLQTLVHGELLSFLKEDSIIHINQDETTIRDTEDMGILEFDSYQYDTIRSVKSGVDCYKKELDHTIDALRYILQAFIDTGRWYEK